MRWFLLLIVGASPVWAQPLVAPVLIPVPDPGNYGTTGSGSVYGGGLGFVRHKFFVGAYEVSNDEYCRFLNAVDPFGANALLLYSTSMAASPSGGIAFTAEAPAGAKYSTLPNMADKPVNFVSWLDAARFCNWINNGSTATASTEFGAYDLSGPSATNATRLPGAVWFLPSEDEWFKAAYGYPTGLPTAKYSYFSFATGNTLTPTAVFANSIGQGLRGAGLAGSSGNSANFNGRANWNGSTGGNVTSVGGNGGPSFYGAFDIDGNVSEWTDTQPTLGRRVVRGGNFSSTTISRLVVANAVAGTEAADIGFRVVRMSDSTLVQVAGGQLPLSYSWNLNDRDVGPFYVDKYELTASEFYVFASWAASNGYDIGEISDFSTSQLPAAVTLDTAMKWCNAKSQLEGLTPFYGAFKNGTTIPTSPNYEADGYRLLTDAEWEWAARGGLLSQGFTYSGSNDRSAVATTSLTDVGTLAANELGLYDMTGNAREWTGSRHWNGIWFFVRFGDPLTAREGWYTSATMGFRVAKNVPRASQTIAAFAPLADKTFGDAPFQISKPLASSGLYVELSVLSGPARWSSDTTLTLTGAGTVVVAANQAGNNYYFPAEQITTLFVVAQAQQTISQLLPIDPKEFPTASFTVSAPSATSSLPVVLTIKSGPATISGDTITLTGAGTVFLAANQAGDANYAPATEVTTSFNVTAAKKPQHITFEQPAAQVYAPNQTFTLNASSSSGQPVSFLSGDTNLLTIVGNTATMRGVGSVAITATNIGSTDFLPADATRTVAIAKGSQSIPPFAATNNVPVGLALVLTNTNSSAELPVSFALLSGPATVTNNRVTVTGVGPVVLRATQGGDTNFNAASPLTNRFTAIKGYQSIQPFAATNNVPFGTSLFFTNTHTSAGLRVTFERVSGPVTFSTNRAKITGVGAVVVRAVQPGNTNYNAAPPLTNQFTSIKASQAITFNALSNQVFAPKKTVPLAAVSSSGLGVRFTSLTTNVVITSGSTATLRGAGTATIRATQPGNANFNAAPSVEQMLTVTPASQTITFTPPATTTFRSNAVIRLNGRSTSGLPVSYTSGNPSVLSIVGTRAVMNSRGSATITASQSGSVSYNAAPDVLRSLLLR